MDEIRFVAGPIVARYLDKIEEERQAVLKVEEEKAAKKRAELEAKKKAEEEAKKKAAEEAKKAAESKKEGEKTSGTATPNGTQDDAEMKDVDSVKADGVEEPTEEGKK